MIANQDCQSRQYKKAGSAEFEVPEADVVGRIQVVIAIVHSDFPFAPGAGGRLPRGGLRREGYGPARLSAQGER